MPEDVYCYTALIKAAARERNHHKVDALFDKAWKAGIRCAPLFNVIIGSHNTNRNTKVAELELPITLPKIRLQCSLRIMPGCPSSQSD